jgi:hypothetical protein
MMENNFNENNQVKAPCCSGKKLKVINIGLTNFYNALITQKAKAIQIDWCPPVKQSKEISNLLDLLM